MVYWFELKKKQFFSTKVTTDNQYFRGIYTRTDNIIDKMRCIKY